MIKAIQSAPKWFNTAGVGDIYSCRTAIFDWRLSHEKTGERYDEKGANGSKRVVDELVANTDEVRSVTESGICTLVRLCLEVHRLIGPVGNSRPEEGSEHVFFYTLEQLTGRGIVHGQAVGTGYVSSQFQSKKGDEAAQAMDKIGLMFKPWDYGVSKEEIITTILGMKTYSKNVKLPFSILDLVDISQKDAETLAQSSQLIVRERLTQPCNWSVRYCPHRSDSRRQYLRINRAKSASDIVTNDPHRSFRDVT